MKTTLAITFPLFVSHFGIATVSLDSVDDSLYYWSNTWDQGVRILTSDSPVDPYDHRTSLKGRGAVMIDGDGTAILKDCARLYVDGTWEDVEFTAYGKIVDAGKPKSYSGLTMVARSNHGNRRIDGCQASGYYARLYLSTGQAAFQKEYWHNQSGPGVIYSMPVYQPIPEYSNGLPLYHWIGMKFIVRTMPDLDAVMLELWLDKNDSGKWDLVHSFLDEQGSMPSMDTHDPVPPECDIQNGDPIFRPGKSCFLRCDGNESTQVHWRNATIRSIDPTCRTGIAQGSECCVTSCGTCGGSVCRRRPGGEDKCCRRVIQRNSRRCSESLPPCRLIQDSNDCSSELGLQKRQVCCPISCGTCGGSGCKSRPGGAESCCSSVVRSHPERTCDRYPPPCLVKPM